MTEGKLCGGKTFKEVMQEVDFHISDKQRIAELEKENKELKESIKNYVEGYEYLISTYKEQIEKMKNCQNCKHSFSDGIGCMQRARQNWCYNYDKWELVE